jgi:hypothetical protein
LKAGTCFVGDETEHLDLFNEIIHTLMNVSESVDLLTGEMGSGCHQIFMLRTKGKLVSEGCSIDVRSKSRMLGYILHTLPIIIDNVMEIFETLNVIFFGYDSVHLLLLLQSIVHRA